MGTVTGVDMVSVAIRTRDRIIDDLTSDRDDPYYGSCPGEWYDAIIQAMRATTIRVTNTYTEIGLGFDATGNTTADNHMFACIEAGTSMLCTPEHSPDPVQCTDYTITYPK